MSIILNRSNNISNKVQIPAQDNTLTKYKKQLLSQSKIVLKLIFIIQIWLQIPIISQNCQFLLRYKKFRIRRSQFSFIKLKRQDQKWRFNKPMKIIQKINNKSSKFKAKILILQLKGNNQYLKQIYKKKKEEEKFEHILKEFQEENIVQKSKSQPKNEIINQTKNLVKSQGKSENKLEGKEILQKFNQIKEKFQKLNNRQSKANPNINQRESLTENMIKKQKSFNLENNLKTINTSNETQITQYKQERISQKKQDFDSPKKQQEKKLEYKTQMINKYKMKITTSQEIEFEGNQGQNIQSLAKIKLKEYQDKKNINSSQKSNQSNSFEKTKSQEGFNVKNTEYQVNKKKKEFDSKKEKGQIIDKAMKTKEKADALLKQYIKNKKK